MSSPFHRSTSVYTVRVNAGVRHLEMLARQLPPLQDRGDTSLSWRSLDDETALQQLAAALEATGLFYDELEVELTTGLGVHRREVA